MSSRIDPDRTHRIAAELVAQVRRGHREHEHEVWGELLIELLAGGLYAEQAAAPRFAAALNHELARMARQKGCGATAWQLCEVRFTAPEEDDAPPPRSVH